MVIWVEVAEGWTDLDKLLGEPVVPLLVAFVIANLITAFGLALLVLLASPLLFHVANRMLTVPLFIVLGGVLGWGMFAWTRDPLLFASCGALSAALGALLMKELWGPASGGLAQDTLAD